MLPVNMRNGWAGLTLASWYLRESASNAESAPSDRFVIHPNARIHSALPSG